MSMQKYNGGMQIPVRGVFTLGNAEQPEMAKIELKGTIQAEIIHSASGEYIRIDLIDLAYEDQSGNAEWQHWMRFINSAELVLNDLMINDQVMLERIEAAAQKYRQDMLKNGTTGTAENHFPSAVTP